MMCSFLITSLILDSDSLFILIFTIKCSIKLHSLNLHFCSIKKLTQQFLNLLQYHVSVVT